MRALAGVDARSAFWLFAEGMQTVSKKTANCLEFSCYGLTQIGIRSEEHTSELQSLMRISYAVFCLKKKKKHQLHNNQFKSTLYKSTKLIFHSRQTNT